MAVGSVVIPFSTVPVRRTIFMKRRTAGKFRFCVSQVQANVRFGSKADMCAAKRHVRFTPNSDRESRHPQTVMSALPPKADMCGAKAHVCYGPKAADVIPC